tara:strand:- start:31 stop:342 length:312 start_codon:yes stop_codon:yes gene_type:complete
MSLENQNPQLEETVDGETALKEMLVTYVGDKTEPDKDEVTVEMIVNTVAEEFPEFLAVVAEENWIRGYRQALTDVETGQKAYEEYLSEQESQNTDGQSDTETD